MNPLGYDFSISNAALFDIIPQYEPCVVNVSVFPPGAGTFEGNGEYHIGELCTLTASPAEGYNLYCWKKDGQTMSNDPTYTFAVENDTVNIEIVFCCSPVGQITASYSPEANNPNCTSVNFSWNQPDTEWALLKQFDLNEEGSGVATDGEHIYVTYAFWNTPPFSFGKYTMDGVLVEQFNIRNDFDAGGLDYDGTSFYCNTSHSGLHYSKHIHREKRSDFSDEEWLSLLKSNLDLQRPVQYSGFGVGIGHAFVCDGYDENDLLHFNWGWGGNANGYFALGNLYPNGNNLNNNNYAIFDIIPQYEPYVVEASSIPSAAGVIEGNGEYHRGETCTLTATPIANSKFLFWKKADQILSQDLSYSFEVLADVDDIEAHFSLPEVKQITACYAPDPNDPNSSFVSLSWSLDDSEWAFLKQFNLNGEHGLATDEEYFYACKFDNHSSASPIFGKYTLDGELVELFDIEGAYPKSITCDGDYFYCSNNRGLGTFYLYKYDLSQKTLIDSTHMHMQFDLCAYDAENDGFWLYDKFMGRKLTLKNRQGETLIAGLTLSSYPNTSICGIEKIIAKDEEPHLLILIDSGNIRDYDIHNNVLYTHPSISTNQGEIFVGATIGKYNGKDAMFAIVGDYFYNNTAVRIYEINSHLSHVIGYRLYRSDSNGDIVMLADDVVEAPYIDSTWNTINEGIYRFGISEVYANGNASDIIWSEPIENNGVGFEEHKEDPSEFPVQKVLENGQIVIIKDGKRYTITGQQLN